MTRARRAGLMIAAVALIGVVLLLVLRPWNEGREQDGGAPDSSATSVAADPSSPAFTGGSPAPSTTQPPDDPVDLDDDVRDEIQTNVSELVQEVFAVTASVDPQDDLDLAQVLGGVASDTLLSELEAERLEFEAEGWTRTGTYQIGAIEVLDYQDDSDGARATVRVCVDSSDITVTMADGSDVDGPTGDTAWNIFVLSKPADSANWVLVGRTFPDDPAC